MGRTEVTVLVFGVFDTLHEGHRYFLRKAQGYGTKLIVALTPDETVFTLKKKLPQQDLKTRMEKLVVENLANEVVVGDTKPHTWNIIKLTGPDIIVLGYDQDRLHKALLDKKETQKCIWYIKIIDAYKPKRYHSSIRQNNMIQ
jgi:cytidyltransferase-like protein